jgi:hypothetical protein
MDSITEEHNEERKDVFVKIGFSKIYDIDTINQRFNGEIIIEIKWHDPKIKSIDDDLSKISWKPELYVENAINDIREETTRKILLDNQTNLLMISEIRRIKGIFHENLELEHFPLDIQDLTITLASKKSISKVNLILMQPELSTVNINNTLDKSMWTLHTIVKTKLDKILYEFSFGKVEYPAIKMTCQIFRSAGYYYFNAMLPIFLITFASLASFVVDHKLPQSRLPATATMLLSSVSFKGSVNRLLPTVSYLTSLDKYSLASIVIITLILLYHALLAAFSKFLDEMIVCKLDKLAFAIFLTIIIIKQAVYGVWLMASYNYQKKIRNESLFHETKNDKKIN